jgi:hypothetical protein
MQILDLTRDQIIDILDNAEVEHEDFTGYQGFGDLDEAQSVAEAIVNSQTQPLSFSWECNTDGEINMATAGVYTTSGLYLVDSIDRKNVTDDREATGTDAAVAYATAIIASFNHAITVATKHGLV